MTQPIYEWPAAYVARTRAFHLAATNILSVGYMTQVTNAFPVAQTWRTKVIFPAKTPEGWREMDGIIARLKGMNGLIRMEDPARVQPLYNEQVSLTTESFDDGTLWEDSTGWSSGMLPPHVAVGEAEAVGANSVVLSFPSGFMNVAAVLRPGDLLEIRPGGVPATHGHLYIATFTANTDALGKTRVYFEPGLRAAVAMGDMAVLSHAKTVFRLASDEDGEMEVDEARHGRLGLTLIEALPIA